MPGMAGRRCNPPATCSDRCERQEPACIEVTGPSDPGVLSRMREEPGQTSRLKALNSQL